MNVILDSALNYLTKTVNRQSLHALDEDRIKVVFRVLNSRGIELPQSAIEQWLLANNWGKKSISDLLKWANTIESGGSVRLGHPNSAPTEESIWSKIEKRPLPKI